MLCIPNISPDPYKQYDESFMEHSQKLRSTPPIVNRIAGEIFENQIAYHLTIGAFNLTTLQNFPGLFVVL